jgi:hypothetical protein
MTASGSHSHTRVIVVGDGRNDVVQEMVRLAGEYELAATRCDDIYSAAAELARHRDRFLMVTGIFRQLTRGKCDFFALARRHGVPCCCLLDKESDVERDKIVAAVRMGVRLAGEMADIREFLESRLDAGADRSRDADEKDFSSEEFRATEDELKALLRGTHG